MGFSLCHQVAISMTARHIRSIRLDRGERIVAVVPCDSTLAYQYVDVHIVTGDGRLRTEAIYAHEFSDAMMCMFHVGAHLCNALLNAVPVEDVQ